MRLVKSVSISLIAKLISFVIAIPTSIIMARYLGPSGRGVFAILATITAVALQFGNFGLHSSGIYFSTKDKNKIPEIAGTLIIFGLAIGLAIGLGISLLSIFFPKLVLGDIPLLFLAITLVALPFAFIAQFLQNLLLGMQRIYEYNFVDVASKLLTLFAIILLFLVFRRGVFALIVVSTISTIITALVFTFFVREQTPILFKLDRSLLVKMFNYGFKAYIASLFAFLVIRSDVLLVNYFCGTANVGLYTLAVSLTDWLLLVPISTAAMLFPKAALIQDKSSELTRKVSRYIVAVMGLTCLTAAVFADPIIPLVYGRAFAPSVNAFLWLLPGIFFLSLETIYMQDFAARGMPPIVYINPGIGFLVNLGLNLILIPRVGFIAASMTSSLAYLLMFIITITYFKSISGASYRDILVLKRSEIIELLHIWRDKVIAIRAM